MFKPMTVEQISRPMGSFAQRIAENKNYCKLKDTGRREEWKEVSERVTYNIVKPYMPELANQIQLAIEQRKFIPGGRYLYAAGLPYQQINNCALMRARDSKEGWADLAHDAFLALMTGCGIGVVYSDIRSEGTIIKGMGGTCTGPVSLMKAMNENGRQIMMGGSRRSAIWAGLIWNHPDVFKFITCKNWNELIRYCKSKDFNFPAPMDGTNISVILDDDFFNAYRDQWNPNHGLAQSVYWTCVKQMLETGEPGFSIDTGDNKDNNCRNACTEVDSADSNDICNLGSLNLSRIDSIGEFYTLVRLGIAFLLCGTLAGKLPVPEMYKVREKNRRLGLGLMGLHAWLLKRGKLYDRDDELGTWLSVYEMSDSFANEYANRLSISKPVATRAVAPNGTIAIVGETTGGIEPIFAVAYKRRFLEGSTWKAQHVIDPTAEQLINESGVDPAIIEDSFVLADDIERRLRFQAWIQSYVNHGISSTLNLPEWGSSTNNESTVSKYGKTFMENLPNLRGMTTYPNGARDGQPLTRMTYHEAIKRGVGFEFADGSNEVLDSQSMKETVIDEELQLPIGAMCKNGVCGE